MDRNRARSVATLVLTLSLAVAGGVSPSAIAQFSPPDRGTPLAADGGAARFAPPDRGAPESADGGATRQGDCISITPLVPTDETGEYYGLSADGRPTLYWYIASAKAGLETATIAIERDTPDGRIETVSEAAIALPTDLADRPYVLQRAWSEDEDALDPQMPYRWYLEVQCNPAKPNDPTTKLVMGGWLERADPSPELIDALSNASDPLERAQLYGEAGFWFDYMANLLDASQTWNYLLRGFQVISEESEATVVENDPNTEIEFLSVVSSSTRALPAQSESEAQTQNRSSSENE
ncbi:hypothetical protein AY599_26715 [Leptolyngbya valderiana BDU 20041]|nr:hypothetical protein AY599_26715 [Leptolyngbya valderiana BDU 20041]